MGRPTKENEDIIIVNCDGKVLAWCAGALSGDNQMRRATERATRQEEFIKMDEGLFIMANHHMVENIPNVVAALSAYNPGRTVITQISESQEKDLMDRDKIAEGYFNLYDQENLEEEEPDEDDNAPEDFSDTIDLDSTFIH